MKPNGTYNKLIKEADAFFNIALKEYKQGKKEKDDKTIRQGAEKAWNAAVQATKALAVKSGKNVPRSFSAQLLFLMELEKRKIEKLNGFRLLSPLFKLFAKGLHGECFYHGEYNLHELETDFEDVKQFIDIIKII